MSNLTQYRIKIIPLYLIGRPYVARTKTHKKSRIDKKWLKRYGYSTKYKDDHKVIVVGSTLYMSKKTYKMLKEGAK